MSKELRYDYIFGWKLSEWIRDCFERTICDLAALWMPSPVKAEFY